MKSTINSIRVQYTQNGYLYKKDFAKLCAIETLRHITSIIFGEFPLEIDQLELKQNSDNYKVIVTCKPINASLINELHLTFAFRRNSQITAYGYISTQFDTYQFSNWIDHKHFACNHQGFSILFDSNQNIDDQLLTLSSPLIHNKTEFKVFTSYYLIPQLKTYMDDIFNIYRQILIDIGKCLSIQDVNEMLLDDHEKQIIKPYLHKNK